MSQKITEYIKGPVKSEELLASTSRAGHIRLALTGFTSWADDEPIESFVAKRDFFVSWVADAINEKLERELQWISLNFELPALDEVVYLINEKNGSFWIGCRYSEGETWCWAVAYDAPYVKDGKLTADCEIEDIGPTHFQRLPKLPTRPE